MLESLGGVTMLMPMFPKLLIEKEEAVELLIENIQRCKVDRLRYQVFESGINYHEQYEPSYLDSSLLSLIDAGEYSRLQRIL